MINAGLPCSKLVHDHMDHMDHMCTRAYLLMLLMWQKMLRICKSFPDPAEKWLNELLSDVIWWHNLCDHITHDQVANIPDQSYMSYQTFQLPSQDPVRIILEI